jgi:acyl-CoA reductase-like NAD-dependent aldehyde dehydrogenase
VHKVSFTGSTLLGRKIVQNSGVSNLKAVTLELGGKSPCIFFDDTKNLDAAVDRAFTVMFSHKGEKCSEPTRFLIQKGIYDHVLERLIQKAEAVRCGDPLAADTDQGPQCNEAQYKRIMRYIEIGKSEAELVAGGRDDRVGGNADGLFIRPTIFSNVPNQSTIAQEEIFGPVLACTPFAKAEEAVTMANDTAYGLAAGVYTSDVTLAHRMAERLDAGMVFVNRYGCYGLSSPFGGFKESGWGKEMAIHSLSSYTRTKGTWIYFGD